MKKILDEQPNYKQILESLKSTILADLFSSRKIAKIAQALDTSEDSTTIPGALEETDSTLNTDELVKSESFEQHLQKRVFLLFCFQRGFFDVLRISQLVPTDQLELLCVYFGRDKSALPKQSADLGLWDFNRMIGEVKDYYSYLNAKYIQPGLDSAKWDMQSKAKAEYPENLILFDFLLSGFSRKSPENQSPAQSNEATFVAKIEELIGLENVKQALQEFPSRVVASITKHLQRLNQVTDGLKYRQCSFRELYQLHQQLLAKIARLHELAQNSELLELFFDELTQEIAIICNDPFDGIQAESRFKSCKLGELKNLLTKNTDPVFAQLLVSKIYNQQAMLSELGVNLSQKDSQLTKLQNSIENLKYIKTKIENKLSQFEINERKHSKDKRALLKHLHNIVNLTGLRDQILPNHR